MTAPGHAHSAETIYLRFLQDDLNSAHEVLTFSKYQDFRLYKALNVGRYVGIQDTKDLSGVPTNTLLAIFNRFRKKAGEQPLDRFRDRATAEKRVLEVLPHLAIRYVPPSPEADMNAADRQAKQRGPKKSQEELQKEAQEKSDRKAQRDAEREQKAAAKEAEKAQKGPGVIATVKEFLDSENGGTVDEILGELTRRFPEKAPDGMKSTVKIQVSRLAKSTGRGIDNAEIVGRGRVYKFVDKGDIPGERKPVEEPAAKDAAKTETKTEAAA